MKANKQVVDNTVSAVNSVLDKLRKEAESYVRGYAEDHPDQFIGGDGAMIIPFPFVHAMNAEMAELFDEFNSRSEKVTEIRKPKYDN